MDIQQVILSLSPINTKEKVDALFQKIRAMGFSMDDNIDLSIRMAIKKLSVQNYYLQKYQSPWKKQIEETEQRIKVHKQYVKQEIQRLTEEFTKEKDQPIGQRKALIPYISVRSKSDVDSIIAFFKANLEDITPINILWIRYHIIKRDILMYFSSKMSNSFSSYKIIKRKVDKLNIHQMPVGRIIKLNVFNNKLNEFRKNYNRNKNTSIQNQLRNNKSSFDVLQKQEWILDWNCVLFQHGKLVIYSRTDIKVKFKPVTIYAPKAIESFNYLRKYLNERLPPIRCSIVGQQLSVVDKIDFNKAIQQFSVAARQSAIKTGDGSLNIKLTPTPISFSQALSRAKQLSPEEFKKYKSKYIDYLVERQSARYKIIPCIERIVHTTDDITEYAFLFSIEGWPNAILIVHENVNPDRSTLLFLVDEKEYDNVIRGIYDFLQSAEINKRSNLREKNLDINQPGILIYKSINHDDSNSWQSWISQFSK